MAETWDYPNPEPLAAAGWLNEHLNDAGLRIIDGRGGREYAAGHIPGAILLPAPAFKAAGSSETCSPDEFAAAAGAMGIRVADTVVCYDANGPTAARAWWAFTRFGHQNVKFLHGGFDAWLSTGGPLSTDTVALTPSFYDLIGDRPGYACTLPQALASVGRSGVVLWDTRSEGEFTGADPRTIDPEKAGHIPGAVHLQYSELVDKATGMFKPAAEMRQLLAVRGITPESEVVAY